MKNIEVTKDDIRDGVKCDHDGCPLYLAIKRTYPGVVGVSSTHAVFPPHDGFHVERLLPDAARGFVRSFDAGKYVRPINFQL